MRLLSAVVALFLALSPSAVSDRFARGETLDYDVRWSHVAGGVARLAIAPAADDESRYRITFVIRSAGVFARMFPVRDSIESVVRRETFSTMQYRKQLDERGRKKDELTVIDESSHSASRKGKTFSVPSHVIDPLSMIQQVRLLDLAPGATHRFDVVADGKVYALSVAVLRREKVRTPAGVFNAVVVQPTMRGGSVFSDEESRLWIWYSDDESRLPVQIRSEVRVGSVTATLRAVSAGVAATDPVTRPPQ